MKAGYGRGIVDPTRPSVPFDAHLDDLDGHQLNQLERQAAQLLAEIREVYDRRAGYRTSDGIFRGAPWPVDHGSIPHLEWLDHPYKVLHEKGETFVSEPYHVTNESLPELAAIAEDGWFVAFVANHARWFPGSTVAIEFTRR